MIQFNFSPSSSTELETEVNAQSLLFSQIEVLGYLNFSHQLLGCMKNNYVGSFYIKRVSAKNMEDTEYEITLSEVDYIHTADMSPDAVNHDYDNWDICFVLGSRYYPLWQDVSVQLDPYHYENKRFFPEIDNIMSNVCPEKVYTLWKLLENKSQLEKEISPLSESHKKIGIKI